MSDGPAGYNPYPPPPPRRGFLASINQYGAPNWLPGQPAGPNGVNGYAVASLILSILMVFGIGSVLGIVFGVTARRQNALSGRAGSGIALAGIIVGIAGLVVAAAIIAVIALRA